MKKIIKSTLLIVMILLGFCILGILNSVYGWVNISGVDHLTVERDPSWQLPHTMSTIRPGAEVYYDMHNNSYGTQKITSYDTCFAIDNFFSSSSGSIPTLGDKNRMDKNSSTVKNSMLCAIGKDGQTYAMSIKYFKTKFFLSEKIREFFSGKVAQVLCLDNKKILRASQDNRIVIYSDGTVSCEVASSPQK